MQSIPQVSSEPVINVAVDTLVKHKQALIFVASKRSAQKAAADISKHSADVITHKDELKQLSQTILTALSPPTEQCKKLAHAIERGVAFHHSGLAPSQRTAIEHAFRAGTLKLIACTPTLAAGLDMPAFRSILKDVKRYNGAFGMDYIPVLEYQQMAGRAGRPGKEDFGEAIMIASTEREKLALIEKFIFGDVEDIYSKLAVEPVLRMYVLSLVATGLCRTKSELAKFFSQTFWAHQYKDLEQLQRIIERVIRLLISYEFIEQAKTVKKPDSDFMTAADLFEQRDTPLIATQLGMRVSQLYLDPLSANHIIQGLKKANLTVFGVVHLLCQTLEMRPQLPIKKAEQELFNTFLFKHESELLCPLPTFYDVEYEDFFASLKTTAYMLDWIEEFSEQSLFEKYDIRPGDINAKNEIMDWLLYCSVELSQALNLKQHIGFLTKLRTRVSYGAKEDLLILLQLKGIGRVRSRQLATNNIRTIKDIQNATLGTLAAIIGPAIAADIKRQVGQNPDELKKEKTNTLFSYHHS
ncbi:MAG TPA: helicase-related protein [Acidobacteriota bacterium]|nr:helicase-related protein [Acidobacteriota bacterium]